MEEFKVQAEDIKMSLVEEDPQIQTNKNPKQTVLRSSFFKEYGKVIKEIEFRLHEKELLVQFVNENDAYEVVHFDDIIGASYTQIQTPKNIQEFIEEKEIHVLKLHLFPVSRKKNICGCETRGFGCRVLVDEEFYCSELTQVTQWRNLIMHGVYHTEWFKNCFQANLLDIPHFSRNLLVFVNPNSGSGEAPRKWYDANIILVKAGYEINKVDTTHAKHCLEYLQSAPSNELKKYDGVVAVSGDGLIHEIINGLFGRDDWEEFKNIAVGYIPGGSGNAHLKNISERASEKCNLESAAYFIAKGKTTMIDMTVIELEKEARRVYSFLSFNWCFIADVDLESEFLRCCGGARFDIYAYWRLLVLRRYRAKLHYTTNNTNSDDLPKLDQPLETLGWKKLDDTFTYLVIGNGPFISENYHASPLSAYDDGYNDLTFQSGQASGRWKLTKLLLKAPQGTHVQNSKPADNLGLTYEKIKGFRLEPYGERTGVYSIDGERYESQKAQGWVWEKSLKIFCTRQLAHLHSIFTEREKERKGKKK